jgi:signal transduction histidine kinase/ActR/RegA family two-component response regulator
MTDLSESFTSQPSPAENYSRRISTVAASSRDHKKLVKLVYDFVPTPVILVDHLTARVIFSNRAADELVEGCFPKIITEFESHWRDLNRKPFLNGQSPPERVSRGDKLINYQCLLFSGDRGLPVSVTSELLPEALGAGDSVSLLLLQNIAEFKKVESQLSRARAEAAAASNAKAWFLANVSHEIRTPLNAIIGFSELLEETMDDAIERGRCVASIRRNGNALSRLVTDILDLSRIEAKQIVVHKGYFSPWNLLKELEECFSLRVTDKQINFSLEREGELPGSIETDIERCRQVLYNLIENAIKFTITGSVKVTAWFDQSSSQIFFRVRDTGIGISPDQAQRIFEPFVQVDNSYTRKYGGSGLGLDISRRLARALGGDITLENSALGKGSTFTASFAVGTIRSSDDTLVTPPQRVQGKLEGSRILVVEDAPDNRMLVGKFLKMAGAIVEYAENGLEGVEKALDNDYDAILMDIQMPELDGYEATAHLRWKSYSKPIIALTAHALSEERQKCFEVGCDEHLTKPVDRVLLIDTIARFIRHDQSPKATT